MIWIVNLLIALLITGIIVCHFRGISPFFRRHIEAERLDRRTLNGAIYQERLAELEKDKETLTEESFAQLKEELRATLLSDVEGAGAGANETAQSVPLPLMTAVILMPVLMLVLYFIIGYTEPLKEWEANKREIEPVIERLQAGEQVDPELLKTHDLSTFVRVLQHYQNRHPEKLQGWMMLANIFRENKMVQPAYQAARKAYELAPQQRGVVLVLAELIIQKSGGELTAESEQLIDQYLAIEKEPSLLALKASAAYSAGQFQTAIDAWQQLLDLSDGLGKGPASVVKDELAEQKIAQGRSLIKHHIAMAKAKLTTKAASVAYKVKVDISEELKANWKEFVANGSRQGATLYVIIKASDGLPMPLAVKKIEIANTDYPPFPQDFTLTQQDVMVQTFNLDDFDHVDIIARLSKSGQPIRAAGDWEGVLRQVARSEQDDQSEALPILIGERAE